MLRGRASATITQHQLGAGCSARTLVVEDPVAQRAVDAQVCKRNDMYSRGWQAARDGIQAGSGVVMRERCIHVTTACVRKLIAQPSHPLSLPGSRLPCVVVSGPLTAVLASRRLTPDGREEHEPRPSHLADHSARDNGTRDNLRQQERAAERVVGWGGGG